MFEMNANNYNSNGTCLLLSLKLVTSILIKLLFGFATIIIKLLFGFAFILNQNKQIVRVQINVKNQHLFCFKWFYKGAVIFFLKVTFPFKQPIWWIATQLIYIIWTSTKNWETFFNAQKNAQFQFKEKIYHVPQTANVKIKAERKIDFTSVSFNRTAKWMNEIHVIWVWKQVFILVFSMKKENDFCEIHIWEIFKTKKKINEWIVQNGPFSLINSLLCFRLVNGFGFVFIGCHWRQFKSFFLSWLHRKNAMWFCKMTEFLFGL